MAQKGVQLDPKNFSCSICLDLLKDPVGLPCGHSYCMGCMKAHWDEEDRKGLHSCPQCREVFVPRPCLVKNIMLADLVERLKTTALQSAPADHCYAEPGDVACDVCSGRKLKAFKFCLVCLASYCEDHLQPHNSAAPLRKHKLVEPSKNLQENICSRHDKLKEIFCPTDQQSICYLCTMDQHKGHNTVPAAAERAERQKKLGESRLKIQQRIQDREKDVNVLQQEVDAINRSADKTVEDSQKMFTKLIRLIQKRISDVKQQVRSQQKNEVSRLKDIQKKMKKEITELKRKDAELEWLSHTGDHSQFLHNYPSLSELTESPHSSSIHVPLSNFEDVTAAVSEVRDKLQDILTETWTNISEAVAEVDVLLTPPLPEPKTREEFLRFSQEITLDPNTANERLLLSEGNRKVTKMGQYQSYPEHPDRFTVHSQVLSRKSLSRRCYWEVEWSGEGVSIAVVYKDIQRDRGGREFSFGYNDISWSLYCFDDGFTFWHNSIFTRVSGPRSSRVGVYLDHRAGILSFYRVSETMTLIHRVQTTFTQNLYAGLSVHYPGDTAQIVKVR
ncbi:tripartite motif-containing protein 16-like [Pholidichthys leucotaenia]